MNVLCAERDTLISAQDHQSLMGMERLYAVFEKSTTVTLDSRVLDRGRERRHANKIAHEPVHQRVHLN